MMPSQPEPREILEAAAAFVRDELVAALPASLSYKARVLGNALDLVARQLSAGNEDAPTEGLSELLPEADPGEENTEKALANLIDGSSISIEDSRLLDQLWRWTLARIAIDQPSYASFRLEVADPTDMSG